MTAVMIMTTTVTQKEAEHLAEIIVGRRMAACVQIEKIRSYYYWQGNLEQGNEYRLMIKTRQDRIEDLKKFIAEHHSYEVPELIVIPIIDGSESYLKWIDEETNKKA